MSLTQQLRLIRTELARPLCVGFNNGIIGCPDGCIKDKYRICSNSGDNSCYAEL
jgi:hypothetical protein